MPMNSASFSKTAAGVKVAKSMRKAFGAPDNETDAPTPVGHTRLDEEQPDESLGETITKAIKRRTP